MAVRRNMAAMKRVEKNRGEEIKKIEKDRKERK